MNRAGHDRIDLLLDILVHEWGRLPQVEREIDSWDDLEAVDYLVEWTPRVQILEELDEYARDGSMSPVQRERFEQLQLLIARYRPVFDRLLEGWVPLSDLLPEAPSSTT